VAEVTLSLYSSDFSEALPAVTMAAATRFAGSWLQSKKFDRDRRSKGVENRCKAQRPASGRCWCYHAAFTAALRASHAGAELELRARLFCLKPGWSRGPCGLALNILDPVRLALPRPPNLESQYRRVRKSCQEKKACTSQNVVGVLKTRSICSGVISHTELFFFPSLAFDRKNSASTRSRRRVNW
jgi:hypothetical protein